MKKVLFSSATLCLSLFIFSCANDSSTSSSTTGSDSSSGMTDSMKQANTPNTNMSSTPLSKADSGFLVEAAAGSMMEVQTGTIAAQNAASQRVKDFGNMMATDHGAALSEIKNYAASHGLMIPDALPAKEQAHVDAMKKMTGKAFDSHYVSMMTDDHKKDVSKFKEEAVKADDADLKSWITKTIPTLQKHLDSIQAIKSSMK